MYNVKIYGAGSIGNHLAHGCRSKGWDVLMCDLDQQALERTRDDIYPSRYGQWDPQIRLTTCRMRTSTWSSSARRRTAIWIWPAASWRPNLPGRC